MVRYYKRKGKRLKWRGEDMKLAVEAVRTRHMSLYGAARHFSVPFETLRKRAHGIVAEDAKPGHPTVLTKDEEMEIVETCQIFAEWGFGLRRQDILQVVTDFCQKTKRKNPFRNGVPGDGWWSGFMHRHPQLARRRPQQLQMVRARCTKAEVISHWFNNCLKPTLDRLGLSDHPDRVYNVDEVGFPLSGRPTSVLVKKGMKSPQCIIPGSGRENITVQVACSASGELLPPYIVYSGQRLMKDHTLGGPIGTRYSVSTNGWMTGLTFVNWLQSLFIPSLPQERPVLLILDGHTSHLSYEVRIIARDNGVHLLKLPPHLTHLLQPLDLSVFKPMKSAWDAATSDFVRRERRAIARRDFPGLLHTVWRKGYKEENAVKGFEKAGIIPFNPDVISASSMHYSEPFYQPQVPGESNDEPDTSAIEPNTSSIDQESACNPVSVVEMLPEAEYSQYEELIFEPFPAPCETPDTIQHSSQTFTHQSSPVHQPTQQQSEMSAGQQSPFTTQQASPVSQQSPLITQQTSPVSQQSPLITQQTSSPVSQQSPFTTQQASPLTQSTTTNQSSSISQQTPSSGSTTETPSSLRSFFAGLLQSTTPSRNQPTPRHRLTGVGESLTSEEAIEMVREAEEEKRKKEEEKREKKRLREEKKRQQQQKGKKTKKSKKTAPPKEAEPQQNKEITQGPPTTRGVTAIYLDPCAHCGEMWTSGEEWVECHVCLLCYHITCVSNGDQLDEIDFVCPDCS